MRKIKIAGLMIIIMLAFSPLASALTYLPEDAVRGGMWANALVDTSDEYKNSDGSFKRDFSWSDAHNLLGPIPSVQGAYSPDHSSIITMNNGTDSWAIVGFADEYGELLRVNNDPTNPEGYDGIVWGNAFYRAGTHGSWSEPGTIYLSQDGIDWWQLPYISPDPYFSGKNQTFDGTPGDGAGLVYPGEAWTFDEDGNRVGETGYAGGDAFDMSTAYYVGDWTDESDDNPTQVGLDWFMYMMVTGEGLNEPDCDSMYAFSTSSVPLPGAVWLLGSGFALMALRRRKNGKQ